MNWEFEITPDALKQLRDSGPSVAKDVEDFLVNRVRGCANPRAFGKPLAGPLAGFWRYRVKDYRIVCEIQDARVIVVIVKVAHRSTVYDS